MKQPRPAPRSRARARHVRAKADARPVRVEPFFDRSQGRRGGGHFDPTSYTVACRDRHRAWRDVVEEEAHYTRRLREYLALREKLKAEKQTFDSHITAIRTAPHGAPEGARLRRELKAIAQHGNALLTEVVERKASLEETKSLGGFKDIRARGKKAEDAFFKLKAKQDANEAHKRAEATRAASERSAFQEEDAVTVDGDEARLCCINPDGTWQLRYIRSRLLDKCVDEGRLKNRQTHLSYKDEFQLGLPDADADSDADSDSDSDVDSSPVSFRPAPNPAPNPADQGQAQCWPAVEGRRRKGLRVCRWWFDDEGLCHPAVATVVDWFSAEEADAFVDANGQKGSWPNARAPPDLRRPITHTPSLPPNPTQPR